MNKYELTTETLQFAGRTLHRIKAVKDFGSVKAGKLINADQNGALNIMRKVVGDSHVSRIVNSGHSLCPVRYSNPFVRIV